MTIFRNALIAFAAVLMGLSYVSCSDANEYEDASTNNPSWTDVTHPDSLGGTTYLRASGIKYNVQGQEIQGFVESLVFESNDSVIVKMSAGKTEGSWTDEGNNEFQPKYRYVYNNINGSFEIKKRIVDDAGKVSFIDIFFGTAIISGQQQLVVVTHPGDTPAQTYLTKR